MRSHLRPVQSDPIPTGSDIKEELVIRNFIRRYNVAELVLFTVSNLRPQQNSHGAWSRLERVVEGQEQSAADQWPIFNQDLFVDPPFNNRTFLLIKKLLQEPVFLVTGV